MLVNVWFVFMLFSSGYTTALLTVLTAEVLICLPFQNAPFDFLANHKSSVALLYTMPIFNEIKLNGNGWKDF